MKLHRAACVAGALAMLAGAPAMAQNATPKPDRAPGVEIERTTKLMVGDRAPELAISEWVKGDEVTGFEEGKVYVVEFWATWCGPCIKGMPHLSELQEEYKNKGVTIIGLSSKDSRGNSLDKVQKMVKAKGDTMAYTVAWDDERKTNEAFMRAAGQKYIPNSFVIDQRGYVAWIGHPMNLDNPEFGNPLAQIVAGEWDIVAAAKDFAEAAKLEAEQSKNAEALNTLLAPIGKALKSKDYTQAYAAIEAAMDNKLVWDNPGVLNQIAWPIVDPDADIAERNGELGVKLAERAAKLTNHEDPAILDTLAWAYYFAGDKVEAVKTEMKAIGMLEGDEKAQYIKALERMKK